MLATLLQQVPKLNRQTLYGPLSKNVFFNFQICVFSSVPFITGVKIWFIDVREHSYMISIFLNVLKTVLWSKIWSNLENVPYAHEKNVYSSVFECSVLYVSVRYICFVVLLTLFPCWSSVCLFYPLSKVGYQSLKLSV